MKTDFQSSAFRPVLLAPRSVLGMWVILLFVLTQPSLEGTAPAKRIYIAQFGHGVFGERTFSTEISIDNNSATDVVDVTVESLDDGGAPIALLHGGPDGPQDNLNQRVRKNAVRTIFSTNGTSSDLAVGWVRIVNIR